MEWTSIIVAVLSLLGTFAGSALGIKQSNKVVELRLNILDSKVDGVEKKVDKFNSVCERVAVIEKNIESHDKRLSELEYVLPRVAGK